MTKNKHTVQERGTVRKMTVDSEARGDHNTEVEKSGSTQVAEKEFPS